LDLEKDDETLLRETEEICRNDPSFKLLDDWRAEVFK
jgi:catechol 2,3-dioxygenase